MIHSLLVCTFLFFIRLFTFLLTTTSSFDYSVFKSSAFKSSDVLVTSSATQPRSISPKDSRISRALSQFLLLMNEIPVSSHKYEIMRNLVEKIIDENLHEGCKSLREINYAVLFVVFPRTLRQLEASMSKLWIVVVHGDGEVGLGKIGHQRNRVLGAFWSF
ncbi:hypothetical protein NE237_013457 [Protea cynaroides]|uniref:Uncharacterized protein n=1 Tax=Protea cynaroides TaxID=273540 RepID=A0A9Q0JXW0_9MAGN|nr:hypothetical protein NE237_013457 [Protea cynaroides]